MQSIQAAPKRYPPCIKLCGHSSFDAHADALMILLIMLLIMLLNSAARCARGVSAAAAGMPQGTASACTMYHDQHAHDAGITADAAHSCYIGQHKSMPLYACIMLAWLEKAWPAARRDTVAAAATSTPFCAINTQCPARTMLQE